MSDTPERPEPASSTSAENSAPAESPSPGPPPAPQAESAARNAEPASAAPAPEPPASAAAVPETPAAEAPAPEPPASAAATPPAPATGDAAPAAAPDLATPATAPPAPSALPVPAPAPSALPVPAPAPDRAAPPPSPPSSFFNRVKRVFNFETDVYPEVAADGQAALEAIVVIAVSSLLFGSIPSMALFFIVIPAVPGADGDLRRSRQHRRKAVQPGVARLRPLVSRAGLRRGAAGAGASFRSSARSSACCTGSSPASPPFTASPGCRSASPS